MNLKTAILLIRTLGWRLALLLMATDLRSWLLRNTVCKAGYHKVIPSGEEYHQNSNYLMLHTWYVRCLNCRMILFPTQYQKEMYKRIQASRKDMWANMIDSMLKEPDRKKPRNPSKNKPKQSSS